jgi:hypothetical protein
VVAVEVESKAEAVRNESAKGIPSFEIRDGLRGYDPAGAVM